MSWEKVKLGTFLINRENRFKPNDKSIQGLKRIDKIDFSGTIYLSDKPSNTDMILVKKGDLVISGINVEKGAMSVYPGDEDVTATIHYSSYSFNEKKIDIDFLKLFLRSSEFRNALKEQVPGGIKTEIKPKHLLPLEVVIPNTTLEQREVIKTFSRSEDKNSKLSSELTHQQDLVKQLRQAFLREAMQGKLVKTGHALSGQNTTPLNVETGHALSPKNTPPQNMIETGHALSLQNTPPLTGETGRDRGETGHALSLREQQTGAQLLEKIRIEKLKINKGKKEKPLPSIKPEEIPFEIPENWVWCRLGEIISYTDNLDIQKRLLVDDLINYVDIDSIDNQKQIIREVKRKKVSELSTRARRVLRKNYLMYSTVRPYLKNIAIIENELPNFIGSTGFNVFKTIEVSLKYMFYFLLSPDVNEAYKNMMIGFNSPSISNEQFENTVFPLPPLAEQHRIVKKLEQLMQLCAELEASIKESKEQTQMLLQSALSEALEPKKEKKYKIQEQVVSIAAES